MCHLAFVNLLDSLALQLNEMFYMILVPAYISVWWDSWRDSKLLCTRTKKWAKIAAAEVETVYEEKKKEESVLPTYLEGRKPKERELRAQITLFHRRWGFVCHIVWAFWLICVAWSVSHMLCCMQFYIQLHVFHVSLVSKIHTWGGVF